jgi:hypothetical protein
MTNSLKRKFFGHRDIRLGLGILANSSPGPARWY